MTRWRVAFGAACVVHLVTLYAPSSGSTLFPFADKLVHLLVFALVAYTGVKVRLPLWWLAGVLAVDAVLSEVLQHAVLPQRSGDVLDTVADLIGLAAGMFWASHDMMES